MTAGSINVNAEASVLILVLFISLIDQRCHKELGHESARVTQSFKYVVTPKSNPWFDLDTIDKEPLGSDSHIRRSIFQATLKCDLGITYEIRAEPGEHNTGVCMAVRS